MVYFAAFLAVFVFAVALELFGAMRAGTEAIATSRSAAGAIGDSSLSDDEKERALQRASVALARGFVSIGLRSAAALGAGFVVLFAFDVTGLASLSAATAWLGTWEAIVAVTVIIVFGYWLWYRI